MSLDSDTAEKIQSIVVRDHRYKPEAYAFTIEGLRFTLEQRRRRGLDGHITGRELLDGIRELALERFGFLSRAVFRDWGLTATADFGEIVFNLIEVSLLSKQETDTKQDFAGAFDFAEAFEGSLSQSPGGAS